MPDLDTSIATRVQTPQINPLQLAMELQSIKGEMLKNRMMAGMFAGNAARTHALRAGAANGGAFDMHQAQQSLASAPGAETGEFDPNEGLGAVAQGQSALQGADLARVQTAHAKLNGIVGLMAPLIAKQDAQGRPTATSDDAQNAINFAVSSGMITPPEGAAMHAEVAKAPSDTAGFHQFLMQTYTSMQDAASAHANLLPQPSLVNTGAATLPVDVNPVSNPNVMGTNVPNQVGPQIVSTPVGAVNVAPGGQSGTPVTLNQPAPAAGASPGGAPGGSAAPAIVGAPSPGPAFAAGEGANLSDYQKNLSARVQSEGKQMVDIRIAREMMQKMQTGGFKAARVYAAELAQAIPGMPTGVVDAVAGGDLGAAQVIQKLAVQNAMNQMMANGGGGNESEFSAFLSNLPNINTDPRAAEEVFNYFTQIYHRDNAELQEFGKYTQGNRGTGNVAEWQSAWQKEAVHRGMIKPEFVQGQARGTPPLTGAQSAAQSARNKQLMKELLGE